MEENKVVEITEEVKEEEKVTFGMKAKNVWKKTKPYLVGGVVGAGGLLVLAILNGGEENTSVLDTAELTEMNSDTPSSSDDISETEA